MRHYILFEYFISAVVSAILIGYLSKENEGSDKNVSILKKVILYGTYALGFDFLTWYSSSFLFSLDSYVKLIMFAMIYFFLGKMLQVIMQYTFKEKRMIMNKIGNIIPYIMSANIFLIKIYEKISTGETNKLIDYPFMFTVYKINVFVIAGVIAIILIVKTLSDYIKYKIINFIAIAPLFVIFTVVICYSVIKIAMPVYPFVMIIWSIIGYINHKIYTKIEVLDKAVVTEEDKISQFIQKYGITEREREIIDHLRDGKTNKEIGEILFISEKTVKNHLSNIYRKAEVSSRIELYNIIEKNK